jgi:hypothetical protein
MGYDNILPRSFWGNCLDQLKYFPEPGSRRRSSLLASITEQGQLVHYEYNPNLNHRRIITDGAPDFSLEETLRTFNYSVFREAFLVSFRKPLDPKRMRRGLPQNVAIWLLINLQRLEPEPNDGQRLVLIINDYFGTGQNYEERRNRFGMTYDEQKRRRMKQIEQGWYKLNERRFLDVKNILGFTMCLYVILYKCIANNHIDPEMFNQFIQEHTIEDESVDSPKYYLIEILNELRRYLV